MDDEPLITVAIPTYNRADGYFREAFECALSQTYSNFEIIVSDNCSTDSTEELVKSYVDRRIFYYKQKKNIPANDNFNFCLKNANGKYFILLHDDDLIDHKFLEKCVNRLRENPDIGIVRTGARIIDANGGVIKVKENNDEGLSVSDYFYTWLEGRSLMLLCCILFNTKYLIQSGGFNSKYQLFQDVLAEFILASKYGRIDIKEVMASFRKHPFQRTENVKVKEWCDESIYLLDKMCELAPENREIIMRQGLVHFSKHNYGIAENIKQIINRHIWYFRIYKKFQYKFSPLQYFYRKYKRKIFSVLGKLKRKVFVNCVS